MTADHARQLLKLVLSGQLNADHDNVFVSVKKTELLPLIDAFLALDEVHRLADYHVGEAYRKTAHKRSQP